MGRLATMILKMGWAVFLPRAHVHAAVPCETTVECEEKLRPGSICRERRDDGSPTSSGEETEKEKYCTNPFSSGCLNRILGDDVFPKKRVCNSDDGPGAAEDGLCRRPPISDFTEIRIGPANWESSMFLSWAMQIFLSELGDVPSTLETGPERDDDGGGGGKGLPLNFYDADNAFNYPPMSYNFEALYRANAIPGGDCSLSPEPCAHVLPEVWQVDELDKVDKHQIDRDGSGMVGRVGWFMPQFAAQIVNEKLMTHWDLRGEANREKLARTFLRPTSWGDYCREVSPTNCTGDSGGIFGEEEAATRPPEDESESGMYHHPSAYKGHFRATDENNCSLPGNEKKCTGHIVDYPCFWAAYTQSQLYWNDIALNASVPGKPTGYSYSNILQIMAASNATRSPAMFVWWYPELNVDRYKMVSVSLPEVTTECLRTRPEPLGDNRCGEDMATLLGEEVGSCGYHTHDLEKHLASSLRKNTFAVENEADRSPAYGVLRNFHMSDIDMRDIIRAWAGRGVDMYGYDPREAVCTWVANNIFEGWKLSHFVPEGYPRTVVESSYKVPLLRAAMAVSCLAIAVVLTIASATIYYREERVFRYAQLHFLRLFCLGYLLVATGAAVHATEPTEGTCVVRQWLIVIGYTVGIVPLLVKVAAINQLMQQSKRCKRVTIPQQRLRVIVGAALLVITTFLSVWTAVDPSTRVARRALVSPSDGLVEVQYSCSSSSMAWKACAFGWEAIYMITAAILAFVSRNVRQEFNESRKLGNMVYSHSLFLILRVLVHYILPSAGVEPQNVAAATAFLLSMDSMTSPSLYFVPKFLAIRNGTGRGRHTESLGIRSAIRIPNGINNLDLTETYRGCSRETNISGSTSRSSTVTFKFSDSVTAVARGSKFDTSMNRAAHQLSGQGRQNGHVGIVDGSSTGQQKHDLGDEAHNSSIKNIIASLDINHEGTETKDAMHRAHQLSDQERQIGNVGIVDGSSTRQQKHDLGEDNSGVKKNTIASLDICHEGTETKDRAHQLSDQERQNGDVGILADGSRTGPKHDICEANSGVKKNTIASLDICHEGTETKDRDDITNLDLTETHRGCSGETNSSGTT